MLQSKPSLNLRDFIEVLNKDLRDDVDYVDGMTFYTQQHASPGEAVRGYSIEVTTVWSPAYQRALSKAHYDFVLDLSIA